MRHDGGVDAEAVRLDDDEGVILQLDEIMVELGIVGANDLFLAALEQLFPLDALGRAFRRLRKDFEEVSVSLREPLEDPAGAFDGELVLRRGHRHLFFLCFDLLQVRGIGRRVVPHPGVS